MADKPNTQPDPTKDQTGKTPYPGMIGDGTEEQNLNQTGQPGERITKEEVETAFSSGTKTPDSKT